MTEYFFLKDGAPEDLNPDEGQAGKWIARQGTLPMVFEVPIAEARARTDALLAEINKPGRFLMRTDDGFKTDPDPIVVRDVYPKNDVMLVTLGHTKLCA